MQSAPMLRAHSTKTPGELRRRIDDYSRLRRVTLDELTVDALDFLIGDAQDQLRVLERH